MIKNPNRRTGIAYENHKWYLCRSVTPTGETKTVYNISVDEDESYIADSIVVHNCQDLSVAGRQLGINKKCPICNNVLPFDFSDDTCPKCGAEIEFTRSGLFMEQIRLIKEMRNATNERFPKIVVWENVLGALSSNNGDDFNCVLSEFLGLLGEKLPTLRPEKWTNAGEIVADKGSLAWRLFDAQYWGVPQRRRRIYLVVDLTGQRAGEILFKSESLRRHTPQGEVPWKRTTSEIKSSLGTTDRAGTTGNY
jgi:site-specific DNA-cytosine methylase